MGSLLSQPCVGARVQNAPGGQRQHYAVRASRIRLCATWFLEHSHYRSGVPSSCTLLLTDAANRNMPAAALLI